MIAVALRAAAARAPVARVALRGGLVLAVGGRAVPGLRRLVRACLGLSDSPLTGVDPAALLARVQGVTPNISDIVVLGWEGDDG